MTLVAVLVVVVVVLIAGVIFLRRTKSAPPSWDAQVVSQLAGAGSNISEPHPLEFYLYFPEEAGAKRASEKLVLLGFEVEVQPLEGDLPWVTIARKSMVPDVAELERLRKVMKELCVGDEGVYGDWGSPILK